MIYKLTDYDGYTRRGRRGETRWEVGATVAPTGEGTTPCGPGVLHLYASALEAVLYNPSHASIKNPRLFEVEAIVDGDDGMKAWTTRPVTVLREIELPVIAVEQIVAWAICLAPHSVTRAWAIDWLSGADRSVAGAARAAAARAADAARAAWAAAAAARAAWAMDAAREAREAREAWAAGAARAAARAAGEATGADPSAFRARALRAFDRAQRILAGELPAEQYDREQSDGDGI